MSKQNSNVKDKIAQLDELVSWFDGPDFSLEQALDKFKEAEKLANDIERDLMELKNEIHLVKKRFDEA